jgi:hypothetical protein
VDLERSVVAPTRRRISNRAVGVVQLWRRKGWGDLQGQRGEAGQGKGLSLDGDGCLESGVQLPRPWCVPIEPDHVHLPEAAMASPRAFNQRAYARLTISPCSSADRRRAGGVAQVEEDGCNSAAVICVRHVGGSRSPSEARINGLGEGRSLYMTILSGG